MRLQQYITEKASKNTIVCDVQPMYEQYQSFETYEFTEFLNTQTKQVMYYFNGPDTVGTDTESDIKYWLIENGLNEEKLNDITFFDKGYAYFRSFMDEGISEHTIIKMIRYMFKTRQWDSRDIENEEWEKALGSDYDSDVEHMLDSGDMIYPPDIDIRQLRQHGGGYIVGGGKRECLAELQLLMSAFNIKAREIKRYVY